MSKAIFVSFGWKMFIGILGAYSNTNTLGIEENRYDIRDLFMYSYELTFPTYVITNLNQLLKSPSHWRSDRFNI
jgi:hypothetical protein